MTRPTATTVVATIAAVGGAVIVLVVKRAATGEWQLLEFLEDLIRNGLIAGSVSFAAAHLEKTRRRDEQRQLSLTRMEATRLSVISWQQIATLAANAWNQLPGDRAARDATMADLVDLYRSKSRHLRETAASIEKIHGASLDDEEGRAEVMVGLLGLPNKLSAYVEEGQRSRRFSMLERLSDEFAHLEAQADPIWSPIVGAFRRAVPAAIGWRSHTNATIIERLLVEQSVHGSSQKSQTDEGRDLRSLGALDPAAVALEPVYRLVSFLVAAEELIIQGDPRPINAIRRCLGALRNEMRMIAAAYDALVPVLVLANERSEAVHGVPQEMPAFPDSPPAPSWGAPAPD